MVIIFEGIDRVGKTTMANKVAECIGGTIFKAQRVEIPLATLDENDALSFGYCMGQVQLFNETYAKDHDNHIIIDRFHWTEYVYTKIERNKHLSDYYLSKINAEMMKCKEGYLMVFIKPVNIKTSSKEHGRDLTRYEEMFEDLYDASNLNKYRGTWFNTELVLDNIIDFVNGRFKGSN